MSDEKLVRGIGRWDLTAVVINCIIGAGIFGLPAKVYAAIGSYSLFAFGACALIVSLIVLCYAEVASRFSSTGGPYLYAREAFGPVVAFEVGWLYWIVRLATFAANCNLVVTYIGFFWPDATQPAPRIVLIFLAVATLTIVNVMGVRQSSKMTNFFTVGKLVPLLIFVVVGSFFINPQNFDFGSLPGYTSFSGAVLLLIYAFAGFEVAVIPAGEAKDPRQDFPFALFVGLAAVAAIYIFVQLVAIGTLPALAASERPLADAAVNFIGPAGAALIAIGAIISILGNLNVSVLGGSRILFAMGEHDQLPQIVSRTHPKYRTPVVSLLLNAVIVLFLTIYSSFLSALAIATITRLLVYATTCMSLPIFRRRPDAPEAKFKARYGIFISITSMVLILWLLSSVHTNEAVQIAAAAVIGLVVYFLFRTFRKPPLTETSR